MAHLPGIKKALRKQGVCVNHLNRCKTSFCCFSWICFLPNNQLQGAQAHCGYLCQRSYSTMGEAEIDHLRVPASAKPRTGMSFFSNIFQTKLQLEDLLSMLDVWSILHPTRAMKKFRFDSYSSLLFHSILSGLIGVFLHVRCIPHQNSQ